MAVILSAQATDKGVNKATARLFPVANTPEDLAARTAVTQQGQTLGIVLRDLHGDLTEARFQLDETIHVQEQFLHSCIGLWRK